MSVLRQRLPQNSLLDCRRFIHRNFVGRCILNINLKCRQTTNFYEYILKYFPDNTFSQDRFKDFSKQFIQFMVGNKKFSKLFLSWVTKIHSKLFNEYSLLVSQSVNLSEFKMYMQFLIEVLEESLKDNTPIDYVLFGKNTVSGETPFHPDRSIIDHNCLNGNCESLELNLNGFPLVRQAILNFKNIFLEKCNNTIFFTSLDSISDIEKSLIDIQLFLTENSNTYEKMDVSSDEKKLTFQDQIKSTDFSKIIFWDILSREKEHVIK